MGMGMKMGGNGNYFSGINGNGSEVSELRSPGKTRSRSSYDHQKPYEHAPEAVNILMQEVTMKSWEWEGMVCQKLFPHISSPCV